MSSEDGGQEFRQLSRLFFRKFFNNELIALETDTWNVIQVALTLAVPAAIYAFDTFRYNRGDVWSLARPQCFFVGYPMAVAGIIAVFEWDLLYPDQTDFLVLGAMPLRRGVLIRAKAAALAAFLGIFLLSASVPSALLMGMMSTMNAAAPNPLRQLVAQSVSVLAAGAFAAFTIVALRGLCVCVLPARWSRVVAAVMQVSAIALLLNLLFSCPLVGTYLKVLVRTYPVLVRRLPIAWFVGLYEWLAYGAKVESEFRELAALAGWALAVMAVAAALLYVLGWRRCARQLAEGEEAGGVSWRALKRPISRLLDVSLLRHPVQRATFHFISKTLARSTRHRVYLSMYVGVGLAFGLAALLRINTRGARPALAMSASGTVTFALVLSYCVISGLRGVFNLPVEIKANWIYQLTEYRDRLQHLQATHLWVILSAVAVAAVYAPLLWLNFPAGAAVRHLLFLLVTELLMVQFMFQNLDKVPFTCKPAAGRANLAFRVAVYFFGFPMALMAVMDLEADTVGRPKVLVGFVVISAAVLALLVSRQRKRATASGPLVFVEPDTNGYQWLGLEGRDSPAPWQ